MCRYADVHICRLMLRLVVCVNTMTRKGDSPSQKIPYLCDNAIIGINNTNIAVGKRL